jgi:hypothetical protein
MKVKFLRLLVAYGFFSGLALTILCHFPITNPATAQSSQRVKSWIQKITPKTARRTGRQVSMSTRNDTNADNLCGKTVGSLSAIVPSTPKTKNLKGEFTHYISSLTMSENPTFWVYIPYQTNSPPPAKFELFLDDQLVTSEKVVLPTQPGLYPLLLKTITLKPGQEYSWKLVVTCVEGVSPDLDRIGGWIERIESKEIQQKLKNVKTVQQKLETYVDHELWHESMEVLTGDFCRQDPMQARQLLNQWMSDINLADLVEKSPQPLLEKCQ